MLSTLIVPKLCSDSFWHLNVTAVNSDDHRFPGFEMPAWFDLLSLDPNGAEDVNGIRKSSARIVSIIEKELQNNVPPGNIILGGFSQGGALALYTGLTCNIMLGGIVALSSWLPMHQEFSSKTSKIPVLQCHGDCDPVVPYKWGQLSSTFLKKIASSHDFKTYRGLGHSSSEEEMEDVKTFIMRQIT